jgi:cytochrome bd ubiquinol oxidase subunit II
MLNSIGPVWDGNEVWLVTGGGALFAGFPEIYASLLSGFYEPVMLLLSGLIFRAVAIEFRSKQPMKWWRQSWDIIFAFGSFLITLLLGIIMGNLITGMQIDEHRNVLNTWQEILNPYALLASVFTISIFLMHGAIYLTMKTEGDLHDKIRDWIQPCIIFFIICYVTITMATLIYMPHMISALQERPVFFAIAILNMLVIANIPREIFHGRDGMAFISSCVNIICLFALFAIGAYPNVLRAINNPEFSLTIYNSASSPKTLQILFLIAFIGMPLVISYTIAVYTIFRGKVKIEPTSY